MIRYPIDEDELLARIEAEAPGWLDKAREKTKSFRAARKYDEKEGSWSKIKPVYMQLQHNKCAYCERKLEGEPHGPIEHDIEHFRPKREVIAWPDERVSTSRNIQYDFDTGGAHPAGYYLLSYAPLNYAASCKVCNTPLKGNHFPIAGKRRRPSADVRAHASEKPFLIYPISDLDEDPEQILTFDGVVPIPRHKSGAKHRRAVVTIDFFELDTREHLLRERAERIVGLYLARERKDDPIAQRYASALVAPSSPHANCTRAFDALCDADPTRADKIADEASRYIASQSS